MVFDGFVYLGFLVPIFLLDLQVKAENGLWHCVASSLEASAPSSRFGSARLLLQTAWVAESDWLLAVLLWIFLMIKFDPYPVIYYNHHKYISSSLSRSNVMILCQFSVGNQA